MSMRAGIPTKIACEAFEIAKKIPECLLTKVNDKTDYTIGLG